MNETLYELIELAKRAGEAVRRDVYVIDSDGDEVILGADGTLELVHVIVDDGQFRINHMTRVHVVKAYANFVGMPAGLMAPVVAAGLGLL